MDSSNTLEVGSGLSNAGYALGAVVAADLAQRFVQRQLFLMYEAVFVLASVLAAVAPNVALYLVGHVLLGMATGLLLVAALPPLILRSPTSRLPLTVGFVNIGLFGAIALGRSSGMCLPTSVNGAGCSSPRRCLARSAGPPRGSATRCGRR